MPDPAAIPVASERLRPGQVVSWCLFDFANSTYSAIIAATLFPNFYSRVVVGAAGGHGDAWWGRVQSASMLFVAFTSPFVGGLAERSGYRRALWIFYTAACIGCVGLFTTLGPGDVLAGFFLATLANIGMEGGVVFYNSYLPRIAPPGKMGRVSGWGFATGYAGSILALLAAVPLVRAEPVRWDSIWLLVAGFFGVFALPAFVFLPRDPPPVDRPLAAARRGLAEVIANLRAVWADRMARRFLISYMLYEDGVNTVIAFSALVAAGTYGFSEAALVPLYLCVQASALAGAWLMARPTDVKGPKFVITCALLLWCAVVLLTATGSGRPWFFCVAVCAGLGLGSIQAASRAMFSTYIPPGSEAQYFGVYALVGRSTAWIGPLVFGQMTIAAGGNQRIAMLAVGALFATGLLVFRTVRPGTRRLPDSR